MFKRTVSSVAFAQATNAYYSFPGEDYNLKAIEFEDIFKHALPQKSDDPAQGFGTSAADPDLVAEALTTGPGQTHNIVNNVIDSFRLVQVPETSIPACTSHECKNDAVAHPPTDTAHTANWGKLNADWGVDHTSDQPYNTERQGHRPSSLLMQLQKESIPNCTSFECNNGMISGGPDNKNEWVPANWGKQNEHWGVEVEPGIYRLNQHRQRSIPACNSHECKSDSLFKPDTKGVWVPENWGKQNEHYGIDVDPGVYRLQQQRSIPACHSAGCLTNDHQFNNQAKATPDNKGEAVPANWGKQNEHWGVDVEPSIYRLHQQRSVPACNSLGCKTDSMAFPPDYAGTVSDWGHSNEHWQADAAGSVGERNLPNLTQRSSVPACTSLGCDTESQAFPPDYAVTVPNWGQSNEHWQPTDAPSVGEKNLL